MKMLRRSLNFCLLTSGYLRRKGVGGSVSVGSGGIHKCTACVTRLTYPGKVRFGFIPEEWFTFFYEKTGVTGPYMFYFGLLNLLFSKELYVCDHEFYNGVAMAILVTALIKKFGPQVAKRCDEEIDQIADSFASFHENEIKHYEDLIKAERTEQWRAEGNLMLMEYKKYNIALQLEAAYLKALQKLHHEVKQRLDYQVACANVEARLHHKNMVLWVNREVIKALPKMPDDELKKIKGDLSGLCLRLKI